MNNRGKEILDEFLKENSAYSLRYSFNGDIVRDKDLFKDYLRELIKENEKLNNIINEIKKLDLYISEEDYDYEENPIDKYIPFDIEDYIKELKGDSSNV